MFAKSPMVLVFLAAAGCAAQAKLPQQARAATPIPAAPPTPEEATPLAPSEVLARANLAYDSQLGASRGQFDVERQVFVLQQSVLLYTQFLERAEGRTELEPAVRKSRERIADAQATIEFLRASLKADREPKGD